MARERLSGFTAVRDPIAAFMHTKQTDRSSAVAVLTPTALKQFMAPNVSAGPEYYRFAVH